MSILIYIFYCRCETNLYDFFRRVNTLIKPLLEMFNETTEEMNDTIDEKFNETIEISRL